MRAIHGGAPSAASASRTSRRTQAQRPQGRARLILQVRADANGPMKRVVVLGGTGRVGSSSAASLLAHFPQHEVTLASRSVESYNTAVERRPSLSAARFVTCDIGDSRAVEVRTQFSDEPHRSRTSIIAPSA